MTLYAEWEVQQYRVNFDMMGHGLGPDPQMVNYRDQVAEPAAISIEGYTFGGWFKDISFENEWNFDTDYVKSDTVLYAKWENGLTTPDIEKASQLAKVYGISIDDLLECEKDDSASIIPPAPPGKNIWGTVTIGERGQIVIPKAARDKFGFRSGDRLVVLSDEVGIALLPTEFFEKMMNVRQ